MFGCSDDAHDDLLPDDEHASTSDAIQNGIADIEFDAKYPGSVLLEAVGGETLCSGTLITPRWVLTAAHCIDKDVNSFSNAFRTWNVYVSPIGFEDDEGLGYRRAERRFSHTLQVSEGIPFFDAPSEPFELRDTDIALVRLDRRVPHPIGLSARLPSENECASSTSGTFFGRLVGFGRVGFDEVDWNCPLEFTDFERRYAPSFVQWTRELEGSAAVHKHTFTAEMGLHCEDLSGVGYPLHGPRPVLTASAAA